MLVGYFCFFVTLDSVTFSGQLNWSSVFTLFFQGLDKMILSAQNGLRVDLGSVKYTCDRDF